MNVNPENNKEVCVLSPSSGCPMRCLDVSKLKNYFYLNNFTVVDSFENADYVVFVTCSVSPMQLEDSFTTIRKLQKARGELIVMGCLPGANDIELRTLFNGKAIPSKNISDIDNYFPDFRIKYHQVPEAHSYDLEAHNLFTNIKYYTSYTNLLLKYGLSHAFFRQIIRTYDYKKFIKLNEGNNINDKCHIVICHGCSNNCAYCNIRDSVGKIKSKSIEALVEEYSGLLAQGYRLFHFIADDLCSYGLDNKSSLLQLLQALSAIDSAYNVKWSLQGINPAWLVKNHKELSALFKSKKIWEVTLAIESGSDRIIKLMNRKYIIKEVENALKTLRKLNPGLRIDALFFAGFPTETEDDFNDTLKLIRSIRFDDARVTYYTEFERVPSAKILPKVSPEVVKARCLRANELLLSLKTNVVRGD